MAGWAAEVAPQDGGIWKTLGVARYRAGDWAGAREALQRSVELRDGGDGSDWLFLAMTHWRLGNQKDARQWYERAVSWMNKNDSQRPELLRLRDEAAELLGVPEPQPARGNPGAKK
jgi:uncharacterized protein HemY